jgi:hypothetical protein
MNIVVKSRRNTPRTLEKNFPNALILDLTSKGVDPWVKFSPFYPIEGVPIPFAEGQIGASVEGIWQGLKVFETEGVDLKKFEVRTMKGLKRTVRKFGTVLGHQKGIETTELLPYIEARKQIYAPMYLWVLENKLQQEVQQIKKLAQEYDTVVLLDYETNGDINDPSKPLSHAFLVKHYLDDNFPI